MTREQALLKKNPAAIKEELDKLEAMGLFSDLHLLLCGCMLLPTGIFSLLHACTALVGELVHFAVL